MGYGEIEKIESISYTEYFEKICPVFMMYGMTYDEFWNEDCYRALFYLKAYKLKLNAKDEELWEQGMYIYEAILQCSPILHPFSKATKPLSYTSKPHHILMKEQDDKAEQEKIAENERLKAQVWIKKWIKMNKNRG